ncbi:hypothetical protein O6H91_18G045800 [Diphasiastrum complanatum]|uniref:Uncharacterized protein n=1 Tax=Diphasiastrum complanatum TaxID=34168 RepID=A0ACC2B0K7_DIPCM|nr:hypothetical protein O6H91_18G045800 [Diphasiastrum complanatum]
MRFNWISFIVELIRSVHLYPGDGTFTAIQQEYRLSQTHYSRVSEPVDAFFSSNFAFGSSEQLLSMYKWLIANEDSSWECILEFHSHCPYLTAITPMLSVSRNPALYELPALAHDLDIVEKSVHVRSLENQWNAPWFGHQSSQALWLKQNELLSDDTDALKSSCSPCDALTLANVQESNYCNEKRILQVDLQVETQNEWGSDLDLISPHWSDQDELTAERPLQVEPFRLWGSDIELESPHELDFGTINSSWTHSGQLCHVSVPALESIPSPTSSGITTQKADEFWNSDDMLELRNQLSIGSEFEMEGSSLSSYILQSSDNASGSNVAKCVLSSPLEELSFIKNYSGSALKAHAFSLGSSADGTRSCNSDESVVTATGNSFANVSSNSCSISSQLPKEKCEISAKDLPPSKAETLGEMPHKLDSKDVHKESSSHQRGPTERMMEITLDELSQYFHMPITQASKELKVGLTVLKKRCREFGIPRWPHRKLKSLDSLIHNIQELAKSSQGKPPKDVMAAVRILEEQKKIMEETPGVELAERTKRLRQACFKASYKQRRQAQPHAKLEPCDEFELLTSSNSSEELQEFS